MTLADELTALREAATPGKWDVETMPETGESRVYVPPIDLLRDDYTPVAPGGVAQADADLIVALVNNLPEIVAALEAADTAQGVTREYEYRLRAVINGRQFVQEMPDLETAYACARIYREDGSSIIDRRPKPSRWRPIKEQES